MNNLGPLPATDWLLHMPAKFYEPEWTSSQEGYDVDQMREYAASAVARAVAAERERWRDETANEIERLRSALARLVHEMDCESPWRSWSSEKLQAWETARALLETNPFPSAVVVSRPANVELMKNTTKG